MRKFVIVYGEFCLIEEEMEEKFYTLRKKKTVKGTAEEGLRYFLFGL